VYDSPFSGLEKDPGAICFAATGPQLCTLFLLRRRRTGLAGWIWRGSAV